MKYRKIGLWVTAVILLAVIAVCIFMAVRKNAADEPEGADGAVGAVGAALDSYELKEISRNFTVSYIEGGKISETAAKTVPGWEIVQTEPSDEQNRETAPDGTQSEGMLTDTFSYSLKTEKNSYYKLSSHDKAESDDDSKYYTLTCYSNDKEVWATDISGYWVQDTFDFADGVYAAGETPLFSSDVSYAFFSRLDLSGQLLFTERLDHGLEDEEIVRIVDNGDGTCTVFSDSIPSNSMCVSSFDSEGNELFYKSINMGASVRLKDAICLGDGYLVRVTDFSASGQDYVSKFYKMDKSADITDGFYLESDGRMFFVCDMMEYGGRIYISAYEVLVPDGSKGRYEVDTVMDYIRNMQNQDEATDEAPDEGQTAAVTINLYADTPSEELKEGLKAVYSAVLIICSADNGEPRSCYTVNGVCRSILSLDKDNKLGWKVESFVSASYAAPETDAYCMKVVCNDYLYTFDEDGTLLDSKQDGYSLFFR